MSIESFTFGKNGMRNRKKYSKTEIVSFVCCLIGCSLLVLPKIVDSELDLFSAGLAFNGIGLLTFLFGRNSAQ